MTDDEKLERRNKTVAAVQALLVEDLLLEVAPSDLDPDAPLFGSGHGLDSIDAVELVVALEGRFGMRLESSRVASVPYMRTVNTVVDLILGEESA